MVLMKNKVLTSQKTRRNFVFECPSIFDFVLAKSDPILAVALGSVIYHDEELSA